jgi:hypothetical protein
MAGPAATVVATFKPCEQYKYRVELPPTVDRRTRAAMRRQALLEVNEKFLECTRRYQELGWFEGANFAFTDSRQSPSDSKSEFLHSLQCLKLVELAALHFRENMAPGDEAHGRLILEVSLPYRLRKGLEILCESLELEELKDPAIVGAKGRNTRIGGIYRAARDTANPFSNQPVTSLESFRSAIYSRLSPLPPLRRVVNIGLKMLVGAVGTIPLVCRVAFNFYYRETASRLLARLDTSRNVFAYFDHRSGRTDDVPAYLRWKFGPDFSTGPPAGFTVIPFSHLSKPGHPYSFSAMAWAYRALKRMEKAPQDGCLLVNYLVPVPKLLELRLIRSDQRRRVRRELSALFVAADDFISRQIYKEFIGTLNQGTAFGLEVSQSYQALFSLVRPGVVLQADALSKTARHFTARATINGSRVVYVADRICTSLRTSNQLIRTEGDNPHIPHRFVVFDEVTRDELLRQGIRADRIHAYWRNFSSSTPSPVSQSKNSQVLIFLQAYSDHIGGMIRLGEEIVKHFPELEVVYQEHPDFRVCDKVKASIESRFPGRLRFLGIGESANSGNTVALVTGYSTAVVPGIMAGLPLIWLRRQIDNSVYGEAYLDRIGFAADKPGDVFAILDRLLKHDPATLAAAGTATEQAKVIFAPPSPGEGRTLPQAVVEALNESFAEIGASGRASLRTCSSMDDGSLVCPLPGN